MSLGGFGSRALCTAGFFISLALAGCAASNPRMIEMTAESQDTAVLLFYAIPTSVGYSVNVVGYDPVKQEVRDSLLTNGSTEPMRTDKGTEPQFIVRRVVPGTYVYQSFVQQEAWAVCFHKDTLAFTVKPGQVAFLGTLNPVPHINDLNRNVNANRNYSARRSDIYHYFDNITPPQMILPGESPDILTKARAFVASSMPQVRAEVHPVTYSKASFRAGYTLSLQRHCGGYIKEDPEYRSDGK
jgi:hypothetical protein